MTVIVALLKDFARPVSVMTFVGLLAIAVGLSLRQKPRAVRAYLAALLSAYWILSTPTCAERLVAWSAGGYRPLELATEGQGATLMVVLGGGAWSEHVGSRGLYHMAPSAAFRVLEAVRLYRLLGEPTVLLSGGVTEDYAGARPESDVMRDAIERLGVPADHLMLESDSHNTQQQALAVRLRLGARSRDPIVLVTSPMHMQRAVAVFRWAGLNPIAAISGFKSDDDFKRLRWMPNDGALSLTDMVIYDEAAWLYYRMRGWTAESPSSR